MVVRFLIATVLFVAAGLKAYQLATLPDLGDGFLHARWLNIAVVEFELAFGIWLLSGLLQKSAWFVSFVLFIVFAGISFYKGIIQRESNCGSFGAVVIPPVWTATFDLIV
ncbi:MAG: hypothetical protein LBT05_08240, partial [Planctomycetaceae bacterium]|nr:hypothetical protein [Planctomycetaceae bacterium]